MIKHEDNKHSLNNTCFTDTWLSFLENGLLNTFHNKFGKMFGMCCWKLQPLWIHDCITEYCFSLTYSQYCLAFCCCLSYALPTKHYTCPQIPTNKKSIYFLWFICSYNTGHTESAVLWHILLLLLTLIKSVNHRNIICPQTSVNKTQYFHCLGEQVQCSNLFYSHP